MSANRQISYRAPKAPSALEEEDAQMSSASEAVPVPMLIGTRKIAVIWVSRVLNQRAVEAPVEGGKK